MLLDFPASKTVINKCPLFKSLSLQYLSWQPELTQTDTKCLPALGPSCSLSSELAVSIRSSLSLESSSLTIPAKAAALGLCYCPSPHQTCGLQSSRGRWSHRIWGKRWPLKLCCDAVLPYLPSFFHRHCPNLMSPHAFVYHLLL